MKHHKKLKIATNPRRHIHVPAAIASVLLTISIGFFAIHNSSAATPTLHMPWSSGAATPNNTDFAAYRGVVLDNVTTWPNRGNWYEISHPNIYGAVQAQAAVPTLTLGLAMLPEDNSGNFATCATGAYDSYFRTYGSELVQLNRGNAIVRLGWEANGDWYAWKIGSDVNNYKACFRRQAQAIKSTAPNVKIDWNMNKESKMSVSVATAYPGDDVVDIIGVDFYDMWPSYPNAASWNADYLSTQNGGPRGLGSWYNFAQSHGKKLSVPEWGLNNENGGGGGGTDNAYFIQAMYNFFKTHADTIAYETYFNLQAPSFIIFPAGMNPLGSAEYARQWSAGAVRPPATVVPSPPKSSSPAAAAPVTPAAGSTVKPATATTPGAANAAVPGSSSPSATTAVASADAIDNAAASTGSKENHNAVVSTNSDVAGTSQKRSITIKNVAITSAGAVGLIGLAVAGVALRNLLVHRRVHASYAEPEPPTIIHPEL